MGLLRRLGLRRNNKYLPMTLLDHLISSPLVFLVSFLYRVLLSLRGHPFRPPRNRPPVRVVCVSDTHDQTVDLPPGDVLIHAGDMTNAGTVADIQRQLEWLRRQPHQVKIVVSGNHDSWFDEKSRREEDVRSGARPDLGGLHYLKGELTVQEIKGRKVAIFGAPDVPTCGGREFAFQYNEANQPWRERIPHETDILVTHTPPKHHRDLDLGCPHLLRETWRVRPRLHVFGHIHFGHGKEPVYFDDVQAAYERLLSRPRRGPFWDFVPNAAWLDILEIFGKGVHSVLWKWLMGGPGSNQGGLLVNAAQVYNHAGAVTSRAVVVDI